MAKQKSKYIIWCIEVHDYLWGKDEMCSPIGTSWAVSPAQAVSQFCYREKRYNPTVIDCGCDESIRYYFEGYLEGQDPYDGVGYIINKEDGIKRKGSYEGICAYETRNGVRF